jgi:hypothetical protein
MHLARGNNMLRSTLLLTQIPTSTLSEPFRRMLLRELAKSKQAVGSRGEVIATIGAITIAILVATSEVVAIIRLEEA